MESVSGDAAIFRGRVRASGFRNRTVGMLRRIAWLVRLLPVLFLLGCPPNAGEHILVNIPAGLTTAAIAETLRCHGVIDNPLKFRLQARILGFDKKLRYGRYKFMLNSDELTVLRTLTQKGITSVMVTIPEGFRIVRIADLLEDKGVCRVPEFLAACQDRVLLSSLGIKHNTAEGYLFPDSYEFELESKPANVIRRMARRFFEVFDELRADAGPVLSDKQTVVLASIVEREAVLAEEFPVIAGVFLNRVRCNMPLQSCATVQYVLPRHKEKLTYQDTKIKSPYNTYIHPGLPPGPISNPGRRALRAALSPAETEYLYFVSKGDGSHIFSRTWREHESARRRLRRGR